MMQQRFEEVLDECVTRIVLRGQTVETCLRDYPDLAPDLEPELRLAVAARDMYTPRPEAKERARRALLSAMAEETKAVNAAVPAPLPAPGQGRWQQFWQPGHRNGFDVVLDECITRIIRGEALEDCVARYPDYGSELGTHLRVAVRYRQAFAFTPRGEAKARTRRALQQSLGASRASGRGLLRALFTPTPVRWAASLAAVLTAALVTVSGTAYASQDTIPGDALYPVKTAVEAIQLALAPTEEAKATLAVQFVANRTREVQIAAAQGRPEAIVSASETLNQQLNRAEDALSMAAASGQDVAGLASFFTEKLENVKGTIEAVQAQAPPQAVPGLTKAAENAAKGLERTKERAKRPDPAGGQGQNGNRGGSQGDGQDARPPEGPSQGGAPVPAATNGGPGGASGGQPATQNDGRGPSREREDHRERRPVEVRTEGTVQAVTAMEITVNGRTFLITASTRIEGGAIAVGQTVQVVGVLPADGRLVASGIRIQTPRERPSEGDESGRRRDEDREERGGGRSPDAPSYLPTSAPPASAEGERDRDQGQRRGEPDRTQPAATPSGGAARQGPSDPPPAGSPSPAAGRDRERNEGRRGGEGEGEDRTRSGSEGAREGPSVPPATSGTPQPPVAKPTPEPDSKAERDRPGQGSPKKEGRSGPSNKRG